MINQHDTPASELRHVAFPFCARRCRSIDIFGVCECEAQCPHKFDATGEPHGTATVLAASKATAKSQQEAVNSMSTKPDIHPMALAIYGFAALKFSGQFRRGGVTPAIEHVHDILRISKTGDALKQAVIIGHDLFEDTDAIEEEIRDTLTSFRADDRDRIIGSVWELTKRSAETYPAFINRLKASPFAGIVVEIKRWDIAANVAEAPTKRQLAKYGNALVQLST
jgi:hypothetical protein